MSLILTLSLSEECKAVTQLELSVQLEKDSFAPQTVHNLLGTLTISPEMFNASSPVLLNGPKRSCSRLDIVFVIDVSVSMRQQSKLAGILASIRYVMERLSDSDRIAVVQFNDSASIVFGLKNLSEENRLELESTLLSIKPSGNTNISDGLFTGLNILEQRCDSDQVSLSQLFLLTDGLANRGLTQGSIIDILKEKQISDAITIHSFGYGSDHSSSVLQSIAFSTSGGLYYFVDGVGSIGKVFGECLAGLLTSVVSKVRVRLEAFDGCRFIKFRTRAPYTALKHMKDYEIQFGYIFSGERRTLLFQLSIKAMSENCNQNLFRVGLSYVDLVSNRLLSIEQVISTIRRQPSAAELLGRPVAPLLVEHLNRINAADALSRACKAFNDQNRDEASTILQAAIDSIAKSTIGAEPYSLVLLNDLQDCIQGFQAAEDLNAIHRAHVYSTEHFRERSAGKSSFLAGAFDPYLTQAQKIELSIADTIIKKYIDKYCAFGV